MLILLINLYVVSDTSASLDLVGEDVRVEGIVDGDVSLVKGSLEILGRVRGSVDVVSGDVHMYPGSVVDGDVSIVGGDLILDSGAVVEGDLTLVAGSLVNNGGTIKGEVSKVSGSVLNMLIKGILNNSLMMMGENTKATPGRGTFHPSGAVGDFLGLLVLVLLFYIFFLILKGFVLRMADSIEADTGRVVLFGVISYILILPVLLLLIISVVGILLIPLYLIGIVLAFFVAVDAGMVYVGRMVRRNLDREWNEWMDLTVGVAVAAIFKLIDILVSLVPVDICCLQFVFSFMFGVYVVMLSILGFGALFKWIFRIE